MKLSEIEKQVENEIIFGINALNNFFQTSNATIKVNI